MTETITTLNKKSVLKPYRKVEIKRRLDNGTGDYEADWFDVTDYIVSFGTINWNLDTETVGVFVQSSVNLVGDNLSRKWGTETDAESLFSGFQTRYKTLFKISTGLYEETTVRGEGAVFYGILTDDITLTETQAILKINSLTEIFREQKASGLSLSASDTASDIVTKVLNLQDDSGNVIFDRFINGSSADVTTTVYADVTSGSNLENQTCWDIINRMCLTEDMAAYIGNNGSFYFVGKTSGTDIDWKFNGAGVFDETYGVNIKEIQQSNNIWTKIYNQIVVEHTTDTFGTAGDTWSQGDDSSSDKYGERPLNVNEHWLGSTAAVEVAGSLYLAYREPKREAILTSSTYNPSLKLLDRVKATYFGETTTTPPGLFGISVFGSSYSDGVGLFTGRQGGVYLDEIPMNIIGIELDLDKPESKFILREV